MNIPSNPTRGGTRLTGKVSWFGGPGDPTDSGHTASGGTTKEPGIAVYNRSTLGGYWRVRANNGKTAILRQTDLGPAPFTGRKIDVTYSAVGKFGYHQGNFPTDATFSAEYLGKNPPKGGEAATHSPIPTTPHGTAQPESGSTFDQAAFKKASTDYSIGSLFSAKERKGNPLFETGILPTKEPSRSEFTTEGPEQQPQPAQVVKQGNVSVFVPPSAGEGAVRFGQQHIGKYAETQGKNLGPELNQLEKEFGMTGEPWCAIFATTAAAQGGASRGVRSASVAQINEWASQGSHGYQKGLKPGSQAQPGDLLTFGSQHVGLVKSRHGNTITTIEGNANGSGGVRERTRSINEGQVARPLYRSK